MAIPLVIIFGLCAIPYIDPTRTGQGHYAFRERPIASALFLAGLVGWFVLIAVGMWFLGPGWSWVWPWQASGAETAAAMRSLPSNTPMVPHSICDFPQLKCWQIPFSDKGKQSLQEHPRPHT